MDYAIPWDLQEFHVPFAEFIANSYERGELPLWDPWTYSGRPFFANIQTQSFYPPQMVAAAIDVALPGESTRDLVEWQLALHVFLAGVFCYRLLLGLSLQPHAALAGATAYQLGGYFASQSQHLGAVGAAAWMPLAWLAVTRLGSVSIWKGAALLSLPVAGAIWAGLPASAVIVSGSSALLCAILILMKLAPPRAALSVLLAGVWSPLLVAFQFLPSVQLTFNSIAQYRSDWLGSGGGIPPASLVSLVAPNYYNLFDLAKYDYPFQLTFMYLYIGVVPIIAALAVALWPRRRTRKADAFVLLTVLCVFWMLGDKTPPGQWFYSVLPEFIRIGLHPEFANAAVVLSLAVVAAFGFDRFVGRSRIGYALVLLTAIDLIAVSSMRPMNASSLAVAPGVETTHFDGDNEILDKLRRLTHEATPPYRVETVDDSMAWAMMAPVTQIATTNGVDVMAVARVIQARLAMVDGERWGSYYQVTHPDSPMLRFLNVKYLLSRSPLEPSLLEDGRISLVEELPGRSLYEVADVLPRFYLVGSIRSVDTLAEAAELVQSNTIDFRTEAVVEGAPLLSGVGEIDGGVEVVEYGTSSLKLRVQTSREAMLVSSESAYPGWYAWVDGEETPLYIVNAAFRGLVLPPGTHEVTMRFLPSILYWSAAASLGAWIVWLLVIFRPRLGGLRDGAA